MADDGEEGKNDGERNSSRGDVVSAETFSESHGAIVYSFEAGAEWFMVGTCKNFDFGRSTMF